MISHLPYYAPVVYLKASKLESGHKRGVWTTVVFHKQMRGTEEFSSWTHASFRATVNWIILLLMVRGRVWLCPFYVRREYNLQLSAVYLHFNPDCKKYLWEEDPKDKQPSLSVLLTLCYLCIKPEPWETCTHRSPCSAPLKNCLYW